MNYQALNKELFADYQLNPTHQKRSHIFKINIGLAQAMARNFTAKCKEPYEDLFQEAAKGLWIAIAKFDLSRGAKFNSYAGVMMRHEICAYLRDKTPDVKIPRSWYDLWERGNKIKREQPELNNKDIAVAMNVSLEKYQQASDACSLRFATSLDLPIPIRDDWKLPKEELFIRLEEQIPSDHFEKYRLLEIEPVSLIGLKPDEIAIAQSFYFQKQTLKATIEIATIHGIRRSHVKQKLRAIAIKCAS